MSLRRINVMSIVRLIYITEMGTVQNKEMDIINETRDLTTCISTINLNVPRKRVGNFSPNIFQRYQRNEKALVTTMLEIMYQVYLLEK